MMLLPPSGTEAGADRPAPTPVSGPGPALPPSALRPLAAPALHHLPSRAPPSRPVSNEELVNYGSAPPSARPPWAPGGPPIGPLGGRGNSPAWSRPSAPRPPTR
ncbi:basic proline-rich protein-like [Bos taurus]|uniref:basic proline-rich protein-like n=1 Tax=Bos taurus TaxID=9913 RepID=UPI000D538106|nr:basic proline-rich protein-like [Bos taurus]